MLESEMKLRGKSLSVICCLKELVSYSIAPGLTIYGYEFKRNSWDYQKRFLKFFDCWNWFI